MSNHYPTVKVAAVQSAPVYLNREATVEKACKLIDEAGANGAQLIGFPETYIPGYPWWIWLDEPAAGMQFYIQMVLNAVEIPSITTLKLAEAAKRNHIYVCISVTEKDGASLYLTQLWFGPNGDLLGKHRKLIPSGAERYIWGSGDASTLPVFETEIGRLAGLECWEHNVPAFKWAMAERNEQIHVQSWPACFPSDEHLFSNYTLEMMAKAYSVVNQTFSVVSSQIYTEEMRDMLCANDKQRNIMLPGYGMTMIVDPLGRVLASVPRDEEGICYADIDLSVIIAGKFFSDIAGHEANPSIRMVVDQSPKKPVTLVGAETDNGMTFEEMANLLSSLT